MIKRMQNEDGFTLIELLVVILIIAILVAVAVPSFLGQQDKAKESGANQSLAVAYKAVKADAATNLQNPGAFPDTAGAVAAIEASEPQFGTVSSGPAADADEGDVNVVSSTDDDNGATAGGSNELVLSYKYGDKASQVLTKTYTN